MDTFSVNQIVRGRGTTTFVILALRTMDEPGAQLKEVHPVTHDRARRGEIWLPLTALRLAS